MIVLDMSNPSRSEDEEEDSGDASARGAKQLSSIDEEEDISERKHSGLMVDNFMRATAAHQTRGDILNNRASLLHH